MCSLALLFQASIVPYRGYKTRDGDILLGAGNDRLYGILCDRLGYPEWKTDARFVGNDLRVKNRAVLDDMIEERTKQKTTQEWLDILEGSGMPYSAINDIRTTLNHKHGGPNNLLPSFPLADILTRMK
jgi:succinate--hydroxymethylglutarate CoA-transferase